MCKFNNILPVTKCLVHLWIHCDLELYTLDKEQWDDHFSKCPEELMYYCIHGDCRYIKDQNTPSCRCQRGYIGSRCEYMDLDWLKGDKRQILIICVVTGLVLLILLLVFICICSQ
uniref:Betacellulin, epidermal growth factor family member n=1 Tax=Sphaeramia orbicularis TaxID=375764 RepID=A0A673CD46_9TELE